MNFNIFKKLFSFGGHSSSLENKIKVEEKNNTEEVSCKSPFIIPLKRNSDSLEEYSNAFDEKIDVCKEHADPEKYFKLFAKHLKKFENDGLGKKIALIDLSNVIVDKMIIDLNPKAEYVLVDNFLDYHLLKGIVPDVDLSLICTDDGGILNQFEELQKLNIDMKFDCIIMNPPYQKNLHLKILAEAIKHLKDEKSVCVNLSPIRWLQDPTATLKTSNGVGGKDAEEYVKRHIKNLVEISSNSASQLFGTGQASNLGIYECIIAETHFNTNKFRNALIDKIISQINKKNTILKNLQSKPTAFCVKIPHIYGGSDCSYYISPNKDISRSFVKSEKAGRRTAWLVFNTEQEAENCRLSFETNFWRYLTIKTKTSCSVVKVLPYMGDYTEPWTDERFYKYFNLTADEIKVIEDTVAEH